MKSQLFLVLILLISQSICQVSDMAKDRAWKIQCRIQQKGTFKLSHLKNKDAELKRLNDRKTTLEKEIKADTDRQATEAVIESKKNILTIVEGQIEKISESQETFLEENEKLQLELEGEINDLTEKQNDVANDTEESEKNNEQLTEAHEKLAKAKQNFKLYNNGRHGKTDLFIHDEDNQIELPIICQKRLNTQELLELGMRAPEFKSKWQAAWAAGNTEREKPAEADPAPAGKFRFAKKHHSTSKDDGDVKMAWPKSTMEPPLTKAQFITFYGSITAGQPVTDKNTVTATPAAGDDQTDPADAKADQDDLIWNIANFGRQKDLINWLEFWVYMCCDGVQPKDNEYMVSFEEMETIDMDPIFQQLNIGTSRRNKKSLASKKLAKHRFAKHNRRAFIRKYRK